MKRLLILLVLVLGSCFLLGCKPPATLVESGYERNRRIRHISELQLKMLVEDWDYLWLYERNASTTQWRPWVGL